MKDIGVTLYQRNTWWYAKITRPQGQGRAIRVFLRTKSETEGWQRVKEWKLVELQRVDAADAATAEVWTRMIAGRKVTVRASIDAYLDHRRTTGMRDLHATDLRNTIDLFLRFTIAAGIPEYGLASIASVESKHVAAWVNGPGELKLGSRERRLKVVRAWLAWTITQGWLVRNPAADVRVRLDTLTQEQLMTKHHEAFTDDELKRLLATIPRLNYWHGAVLFGRDFGLTISQVATLEEANIVGNTLRVYRTKGRRVVNEPMTDDVLAWLAEWRTVRPASDMTYLFPEQAAHEPRRLTAQFKQWAKKAGIPVKTFHSLRSAATQRRWSVELAELGDEDRRRLMSLVASRGFAAVQKMLAHADGSPVTETAYMASAKPD